MGITYRSQVGRPLTIAEIDANFAYIAYFTGSQSITGSVSASLGFHGNLSVPSIVTFKPIQTPTVVSGSMFLSSSGQYFLESGSAWVRIVTSP
jgi:hypothetical protein